MFRKLIMWACVCATAPFMCAQNTGENIIMDCDTVECLISERLLDEVVVRASPVINKTDRKIIRPDGETLRMSSDGIELLRKLHLPRISVNPMTNAVTVAGGGDVVLCINGVESTQAQIAAVRPQDVVRVEYHDNPGVRYAGASVVIDYITTHHETGGNLFLETFGALARGRMATIDHLAGQYNNGGSVWSVNAGFMGQHKDRWIRDYDEVWRYPDAEIARHEKGLPVTVGQAGFEGDINYNYQHRSGDMLNVRIGLSLNDVPNKEEGDRQAILQTSETSDPVFVTEHTEEYSASPVIGLYYLRKTSDNANIIVEAQGSYMRSRMLHEYSENSECERSRVTGNKYAVKFSGVYECRRGGQAWNVGVSGKGSVIGNTYFQDIGEKVRINQSETALSGEYSNRSGAWGVTGGLRAVYRHVGQSGRKIDKMSVLPSASVSYRQSDMLFIRYSASLDYQMPSASELSDVVQPIQAGMVRKGNPGLRPFRVIVQSLDVSLESRAISVIPRVEYRNEHAPIMETVLFENGEFVRTYENQRSFQRLSVGGMVILRPWKNHLSLTAEPQLMRYFSHGTYYRHHHNIFRLGLGVDFSYGNWLAYGNIFSGPANSMYGEEIIEEKDMNQILVGYKRGAWSLHLGVFNAFLKNYWMESKNLSALVPYVSKAHSGRSSSYVAVKFSMALDFGRGGRDVELPEMNSDNDTGILIGIK